MKEDKLEQIFAEQNRLMGNLMQNNKSESGWLPMVKEMSLALVVEVSEALQTLHWKSWKKRGQNDYGSFREELIDVLHFTIELCILSGMDAERVYEMYMQKNKINQERIKEGY